MLLPSAIFFTFSRNFAVLLQKIALFSIPMNILSTRLKSISLNRKLALACSMSVFCSLGLAQVSNPVPESPSRSGITLMLERFVTIPSSASSAPRARINHLKPMYDGQGTLAVNDLRGGFYIISDGEVSLYVDFDDVFPGFKDSPGLGTGFTSFAFHPEFASNGIFYTSHSENPGTGQADFTNPVTNAPVALQGVITEWVADNPLAKIFAGTRREVMRVDIVGTIHGMQEIAFNPNAQSGDPDYGKLYICIGDGQSTIAGYHLNTHRLDSVLGTILRIDPAGTNSANGQYGIPEDNPWATDGDPDTFDEIWVYGFRNPHRISWDTKGDGKMLSGDIGEKNIEEVNLIEPGRDYGWNVREGTFVINADWENNPQNGENDEVFELPLDDDTFGFTYPVVQYDHDVGVAIVGGFVYRGALAQALWGKYIFGDIRGGEIYFVEADTLAFGTQSEIQEVELELDGQPTTILQIGGSSRADLRFGFDENNELYLLEKSRGMIFKVAGARAPSEPATGGKFNNISTRGVVGTGDDVLIGGFVIGNDKRDILIQAVGPELADEGVVGFLVDPVLTVRNAAKEIVGSNDNWEDSQGQLIIDLWGGSPPLSTGSLSAAVVLTLAPGAYTAIISGINDTEGVALIEVYEVD
jgi:hypothetical protein